MFQPELHLDQDEHGRPPPLKVIHTVKMTVDTRNTYTDRKIHQQTKVNPVLSEIAEKKNSNLKNENLCICSKVEIC
jgi:hypothetical protein